MIVIVTFNHDFNEWAEAFPTRAAACTAIAAAFEIDLAATPADGPAFWDAVVDAYEAEGWKGFMLYELDLSILTMKALVAEPAAAAIGSAA